MKLLSQVLMEAADKALFPIHSGFLLDCAQRAQELEKTIDMDVRDFHIKFGHPAPSVPVGSHEFDDPRLLTFRIARIEEEYRELMEAFAQKSLSKIAAETVDLVYVLVGTLVALGVPFMPFWRDVHRANMTKVVNPDGGKPLKPEGWVGPNPLRVLFKCRVMPVFEEPEMG